MGSDWFNGRLSLMDKDCELEVTTLDENKKGNIKPAPDVWCVMVISTFVASVSCLKRLTSETVEVF